MRPEEIDARNQRNGQTDYEEIAPHLPERFDSILDIGCGPAWVNVWIANERGLKTVHLMDGEREGQPKTHGYHRATYPWWTVHAGAKRVRERTRAEVKTHAPDPTLIIPVDVIISLKSWCHHYPAEHYLNLARRSLKIGGRLIVDIRNGTDGLEVLNDNGFRTVWTGGRSPKCVRAALDRI